MKNILVSKNAITEYVEQNKAFICLGSTKTYNLDTLKNIINKISKLQTRDYQIIAKTFVEKNISLEIVVNKFIDIDEYVNGEGLYSAKTSKPNKKQNLTLFVEDSKIAKKSEDTLKIAKLVNNARRLQATPPNICNSE